jgi:hypothetical protein
VRPLNLWTFGARRNHMRVFYALLFVLFVLAMGVLEVASSRATSRIADYPDPPSVYAAPALPRR